MPSCTPALIASAIACLVTTLGIAIISHLDRLGREGSAYFICFAAGVLISVSFLHVIPKSFDMNHRAPWYLLAGFLAVFLLSRLLNIYICHKGGGNGAVDPTAAPEGAGQGPGIVPENMASSGTGRQLGVVAGVPPVLAIGLHSLIDGVIYTVTFQVAVFTGVLAAVGMVLHEFPEGVVTYILLRRGGLARERAGLYAFFAAALSTPIGAALSLPFIGPLQGPPLGALLAASAGALVYVGATHLLPEVQQRPRTSALLAMAAGVAVAIVIVMAEG